MYVIKDFLLGRPLASGEGKGEQICPGKGIRIATAVMTLVVLVTKFTEGTWIVILALAAVLLFMKNVNTSVRNQLYCNTPLKEEIMKKSIVVLPTEEWSNNVSKALSFALTLSDEITILYIRAGEEEDKKHDDENERACSFPACYFTGEAEEL